MQRATVHMKGLNELYPRSYQGRRGIHGIARNGGERDVLVAGARPSRAHRGNCAELNGAPCTRPRADGDTSPSRYRARLALRHH